ncbi:probable UDP-arabinose 4-epimerase 1 [Cajanus cajan]|uniref:probable UDP-arabinose 4-epimerase 1 n=1 Tax=Cajanus cajan TaxID=3821 RepID=UPI00098DD47D|nr:probable UDP-arabinose 4-epimerase 1 [Cajanus cajan]
MAKYGVKKLIYSSRSVKEFVNACKKATGVDIKVDFLPRRPGDYAEVYSDPSKINRELNWTAQYTDLEKSRSVKEFVNACKKATGVDIKVDFLPRRPGDYAEVYSDPSKINRELNWTAQYTDLEKSIQIAWKWQKSHRNGYGISSAI